MRTAIVAIAVIFAAVILFFSLVTADVATYNGASEGFVINGTGPDIGTTLDSNDDAFWNIDSTLYIVNNATIFYDNFEGWATNNDCSPGTPPVGTWTKCLDTADTFIRGNNTQANNGSVHLDLRDWDSDGFPSTEGLFQCSDLSAYGKAWLNFWWRIDGLDSGEYGRIDINSTNSAFSTVFDSGTGSTSYAQKIIDISNNISAYTCIGLHSLENVATEHFHVDDLRILAENITNANAAVNITSKQITQSEALITGLNVSLAFKFNVSISTSNWYYEVYDDTNSIWEAATSGSISTTERVEIISKTTNIGNYINSSGYVKVRLRTDTNISQTFQMQIDHINTTVEFSSSNTDFNITLPDSSVTNSSGPGVNRTKDLNISSNGSGVYVNPCIYNQPECQTASIGIYRFNNSGNVPAAWRVILNTSLPLSIKLFGSLTSDRSSGVIDINSSSWALINSSIPVGEQEELWVWANFTGATPSDAIVVDLILNSSDA